MAAKVIQLRSRTCASVRSRHVAKAPTNWRKLPGLSEAVRVATLDPSKDGEVFTCPPLDSTGRLRSTTEGD